MNLNSSPNSPSPINDVDHDQRHRTLNLGPVVSSPSSSSASRHFFFSSTQDHAGFYRHQLYHQQDDSYLYHGGSSYEIKKKVESNLRLALWNREDNNDNRVKWISTNNDRLDPTVGIANAKIDRYSSSFETDTNSNSSLYTPIRVCSDCHTTKTPLWRSGPKGPKSLCNACGIRQRKARRASGTDTVVVADKARPMKIKVGRSSQFKKRCKMADANAGGSKKLGFEDFLINLSNKLALQRVFPQDEKDAAILLMALSSGLLHA